MRFSNNVSSTAILAVCLSFVLAGCTTLYGPETDSPAIGPESRATSSEQEIPFVQDVLLSSRIKTPGSADEDSSEPADDALLNIIKEENNGDDTPVFDERSRVSDIPSLVEEEASRNIDETPPPAFKTNEIDARVTPLPVPAFIDVVFGEMLGVPFVTGPGIANKSEVVQLRSSGTMESKTFLELVSLALKDYGVRITSEAGVYQIIEDQELKARTPQFIKSRAKISTPANLRPLVQFVQLNAINATDMVRILRQALGRKKDGLSIESSNDSNFVILGGLPSDIDVALDIVYQMDELDYAGTQVQRYSPAFWSARNLQTEMNTLLGAEGWESSINAREQKSILMLAINYSNDLMIFTRSPEARARVNYWLNELDQPTPQGDVSELFVYEVQNLDAQLLAETVNNVLGNAGTPGGVNRPPALPDGQGIGSGGSFGSQGRPNNVNGSPQTGLVATTQALVVDPLGNRLIYSGTASDYQRLLPLFKQLDRAPAEVLIEVTIADISLNDDASLGVDWGFNNVGGDNETIDADGSSANSFFRDLAGSIAGGPGGLAGTIANENFGATLDAAANNGDVRILSTPRIITRSGSAAQVQIGSDVPVLSSQGSSTDGGFGSILNTIEYRSTGILLSIEPIVYGNNRVDINISQELSSTSAGEVAGITSPTFTNTSVSTALSLEDGSTAVIGGLIQETVDVSNSGVPILKDLPALGNLFSSSSYSESKREVVIFITAYVLQGQKDRDDIVNEFSRSFNNTSSKSELVTLRPKKFISRTTF